MSLSRHQCKACRLYSFISVATKKVLLSLLLVNPAVVARRVKDCSIPVPPPWDPLADCVASKETLGMKADVELVPPFEVVELAVDGRRWEKEAV